MGRPRPTGSVRTTLGTETVVMQGFAIVALLAFSLVLSTMVVEFDGNSVLDFGNLGSLEFAVPVKWQVALRFDRIFEFLFGFSPTP